LSKLIETKVEFQKLAKNRLEEAKALLGLGKWDGAYYLAGYAVELALKACIIKRLMTTNAFPDRKFSENCYTHDLNKLVSLAGLEDSLDEARKADKILSTHYNEVLGWSEPKRYHRIEKGEAEALCTAIADDEHGVLPWIMSQWKRKPRAAAG